MLVAKALEIARTQIGVRETKPNSGPEVDGYLASVGLNPGYAWCAAFTYWCYAKAAKALGIDNPHVKTAGVLDHYNRCPKHGAQRINAASAHADPKLLKPGMLFVMKFSGGTGHTGFVLEVDAERKRITTIEGNTNEGGSREGVAVMERTRPINSCFGFIDYSAPDTAKLATKGTNEPHKSHSESVGVV